jgi:LPS export ABC transporter protein LptC
MEGRALKILGSLLLAAILVFWAIKPARKGVPLQQSGILPPGADAHVEGVTVLQSGPRGEFSLSARDAEWSREKQNFRLNEVVMSFVGGTNGKASATRGHLTGQRGEASTDGKEFTLDGKVVAETFDGYRLETSDVSYHDETRQVETDKAVSVDGPGLNVVGTGASVDYENQVLEIRGRVRAHMVWAVIEEHVPGSLHTGLLP